MKSDLDRLMAARGFDALVVIGGAEGNHVLRYLTGGAAISHGTLLKKRGHAPVLIVNPMQRDEAAKSGLEVITTAEFNLYEMVQETGSLFEAQLRMLAAALERYEVTGTVSFYGVEDAGYAFRLLTQLDERLPEVTVTGEAENTIFEAAYATKDAAEIAALEDVAARTNTVMSEIVTFIRQHQVVEGKLVKADGSLLRVGDVKAKLRERLAAHNLADDGHTIFAVGRDGGVPHSRGEASDELALGRCIVFDLFPRDMQTGYYHDMTRTFCLGFAPPEVERAYDEVMQAFNAVMDALEVGRAASYYQQLTCDVLEEHGHPTLRSDPTTEEGYVHSLGHGLGLQIHSTPRLSAVSNDTLETGQVFTVEPGVYYPERGYGVRIEDTVVVEADGTFRSLTPFSKDLVIAMEDA